MNHEAKSVQLESEKPVVTIKKTANCDHYAVVGLVEVHLEHLSSFDLQNITEVESHQINRIFDSVVMPPKKSGV